jgi:hypothetical protein
MRGKLTQPRLALQNGTRQSMFQQVRVKLGDIERFVLMGSRVKIEGLQLYREMKRQLLIVKLAESLEYSSYPVLSRRHASPGLGSIGSEEHRP